ncbi:MAG: (2Fe-2S) ferredoxin domain-containing protein [Nitrospinota bacterium]|nr:(2Fe-2S) ferredoxin domain-containing protein [Nitrospinota bacterium]
MKKNTAPISKATQRAGKGSPHKSPSTIVICQGLGCLAQGGEETINAVERTAKNVKEKKGLPGRILSFSHCLGLCDKGPAMLVNGKEHTSLDPGRAREIIDRIK